MSDDPRMLRTVIDRASELAETNGVDSVMVGLAAPEGDPLFPEFVAYCRSALRVEDRIVSLTRERTLVHLMDLDGPGARAVFDRLIEEFQQEFPALHNTPPGIRFLELTGKDAPFTVHRVLTEIFAAPTGKEHADDDPPG